MKYILLTLFLCLPATVHAGLSATFTKVYNSVVLYTNNNTQREVAKVAKKLSEDTSILTGKGSRAELLYSDNVLARIGETTHFKFKNTSRKLQLVDGVILLRVPKGSGGAQVDSELITTTVSGTTFLLEYNKKGWVKLITLEGEVSLTIKLNGNKVVVPAGKMAIVKADGQLIQQPVEVDLKRIVSSSNLIRKKHFKPLPKQSFDLIAEAIALQQQRIRSGELITGSKTDLPLSEKVIKRIHIDRPNGKQ